MSSWYDSTLINSNLTFALTCTKENLNKPRLTNPAFYRSRQIEFNRGHEDTGRWRWEPRRWPIFWPLSADAGLRDGDGVLMKSTVNQRTGCINTHGLPLRVVSAEHKPHSRPPNANPRHNRRRRDHPPSIIYPSYVLPQRASKCLHDWWIMLQSDVSTWRNRHIVV